MTGAAKLKENIRGLYEKKDWSDRLIGIPGARFDNKILLWLF